MKDRAEGELSFVNERSLVALFVSRLITNVSPWGTVQVATEFYYKRGRADVVACTADKRVIAVEAKLRDWRTALHQAFRNRCFAHISYVLLPRPTALLAHRYTAEFDRRRVGLCYLDRDRIVLLQEVEAEEPIEPWLCVQARSHARGLTERV